MAEELQRLMVDTIAEMRELKGELREFKKHVLGRVEKLENSEGKRRNERYSTVSILIATGALLVNIIGKFIP
jgi:hypothetical protein